MHLFNNTAFLQAKKQEILTIIKTKLDLLLQNTKLQDDEATCLHSAIINFCQESIAILLKNHEYQLFYEVFTLLLCYSQCIFPVFIYQKTIGFLRLIYKKLEEHKQYEYQYKLLIQFPFLVRCKQEFFNLICINYMENNKTRQQEMVLPVINFLKTPLFFQENKVLNLLYAILFEEGFSRKENIKKFLDVAGINNFPKSLAEVFCMLCFLDEEKPFWKIMSQKFCLIKLMQLYYEEADSSSFSLATSDFFYSEKMTIWIDLIFTSYISFFLSKDSKKGSGHFEYNMKQKFLIEFDDVLFDTVKNLFEL